MKEKTREYLKLAVAVVLLLAVVLYFKEIVGLIGTFAGLFMPLILGLVVAFVMNVPMRGIENGITKLDKKEKCKPGLKRSLAIFLTFFIIIVVLILVTVLLVPNIISTIKNMAYLVQNQLPDFIEGVQKKYNVDLSRVESFIDSLNLENLMGRAVAMLSGMGAAVSGTFSVLFNGMMSIIIAVYVLAGKEKLSGQLQRVMKAFLKESYREKVNSFAKLVNHTYGSFLTGQCMEAVIIAVLMTVVLGICQIPYAAMIGILAGVLSFIPYIGSLVACFAGAFFILLSNPLMALVEIIVFQVVQFIEGQFIYPRVVGKSVGLPPVFTLVAALLGGKMFGLVGMIFFIPVVAVFYELLRKATKKRLADGKDQI